MSRRLKRDELPDGKVVSTVEVDYSNPFIVLRDAVAQDKPTGGRFETMVFDFTKDGRERFRDLDVQQYEDEAEALKGHEAMVAKWSPQP